MPATPRAGRRRLAGEHVDDAAEQHRFGELRAGQQQIGAGQDPAQPRLFAEQFEDARVKAKQGHEAGRSGRRDGKLGCILIRDRPRDTASTSRPLRRLRPTRPAAAALRRSACIGSGNPTSIRWLAMAGLSGRTATKDIRDVCTKGYVFRHWAFGRDGDGGGGGADHGRAGVGVCGLGASGCFDRRPRPMASPMSAPGAGFIGAAVVRQPQRRLPASSAPASRSPQPRTGAIITIYMAMRRAITVAARSITVAGRPIMVAGMDQRPVLSRTSERRLVTFRICKLFVGRFRRSTNFL